MISPESAALMDTSLESASIDHPTFSALLEKLINAGGGGGDGERADEPAVAGCR